MGFIEQLSWYVPILSIVFVLLLTSINVYIRIRRRFSVAVNCWFCAGDTRVSYETSNSWHCPHCDQYNGFSADGDYNREIPAQRVAKMNPAQFAVRRHSPQHLPPTGYHMQPHTFNQSHLTTSGSSAAASTISPGRSGHHNGLCAPCNLNQELKVQQLAAFEPHSEQTYDSEIAVYQQQLEQAYRLCGRCERHLRRRLTRVKRTVLGSKLAQIGAHGVQAFDMHMSAARGQRGVVRRRGRVVRLCVAVLLVLAVLACQRTVSEVQLSRAALRTVLPAPLTHWLFVAVAVVRTLWMGARAGAAILWLALRADSLWSGASQQLATASEFVTQLGGFAEQAEADMADTVTSALPAVDGVEEKVVCIAALMVCLLLAVLKECRRDSLVVLLLWSLKSVQPTLWAEVADPATSAVWFDLVRACIDVAIVIATLRLVGSILDRRLSSSSSSSSVAASKAHNSSTNSFHRIYTEADTGELSDDYDEHDTTDNTTILSASTVLSSSQSPPSTAFGYRTPSKAYATQNSSANSTLSLSPSVFTPNTLRRTNTMLTSSIKSLNISFDAGDAEPHAQRHQHPAAPSFIAPAPGSSAGGRFQSLQALHSDVLYEQDNDFPGGITQLNISGRYPAKLNKTAAFASAAPSTVGVASRFGSFDQMRHRGSASIIGPARLQTKQPAAYEPQSLANGGSGKPMRGSSWIAGGFWGASNSGSIAGTSPTKRINALNYMDSAPSIVQQGAGNAAPMPPQPPPLMSRTSSQSSGFESRDNGSRESSVGPQTAASISPSDSVSQFAVEPPYQPSVAYQRFGTQRRPASAMDSKWGVPPAASSTAFEPGSLLRSWQLRTSQADITEDRI